LKSILSTRPIYHKSDEVIRGHVLCSFLALVLMCDLHDRLALRGWHEAEWADVLRDLDGLSETQVAASDGKRVVIRSESRGWCGKTYQAAGVAMPPTLKNLEDGFNISLVCLSRWCLDRRPGSRCGHQPGLGLLRERPQRGRGFVCYCRCMQTENSRCAVCGEHLDRQERSPITSTPLARRPRPG
jgi:hypothetical protein